MIISHITPIALASMLMTVAVADAQVASGGRKDTIDVAVGSPLVNTASMVAHQTHARSSRVANGVTTAGADASWAFSFHDSAGVSYLHVESGTAGQVTTVFNFDRKTLALATLNGAVPQLPAPAFLGGMADLLVESLPRRIGVVYRANIWRRGMTTTEAHLFETTGREDIEVLGTRHTAWVIEERSADGARLLGRLWTIDGPPYLVRWMIFNPDGSATQLDQEVVKG